MGMPDVLGYWPGVRMCKGLNNEKLLDPGW